MGLLELGFVQQVRYRYSYVFTASAKTRVQASQPPTTSTTSEASQGPRAMARTSVLVPTPAYGTTVVSGPAPSASLSPTVPVAARAQGVQPGYPTSQSRTPQPPTSSRSGAEVPPQRRAPSAPPPTQRGTTLVTTAGAGPGPRSALPPGFNDDGYFATSNNLVRAAHEQRAREADAQPALEPHESEEIHEARSRRGLWSGRVSSRVKNLCSMQDSVDEARAERDRAEKDLAAAIATQRRRRLGPAEAAALEDAEELAELRNRKRAEGKAAKAALLVGDHTERYVTLHKCIFKMSCQDLFLLVAEQDGNVEAVIKKLLAKKIDRGPIEYLLSLMYQDQKESLPVSTASTSTASSSAASSSNAV